MSANTLHRALEHKFLAARPEADALQGTIAGYASRFGEVDLGRDAVAPGAFAKSLARLGAKGVRMLFQHDPDRPIGCWTQLVEDATGLRVTGRIARDTHDGREVLALLKAGAVDGLSIGFKTVRARTDPGTGVRTILEADLWEISVVTFPMLPAARIDTIKSARKPSVRELEHWLVRDAGLTRSEARRLIAKGFAASSTGQRDAAGALETRSADGAGLAARIRAHARLFATL